MSKITYKWLEDYQRLEDDILYLEDNLSRTKRELGRYTGGDLSHVKLTAKSKASKLEEIIAELEYEIAHKQNELLDLKKLIYTFRGLEHQILRLKYVEGLPLDEVAEQLNYSISHIKKKHAEAMRSIKYAIDLQKNEGSL